MENKIRILTGGYNHNIGEWAFADEESEKRGLFASVAEAEKAAAAEGLAEYRIGEVVGTHKIPTLRKNPTRTTCDVVEIIKIVEAEEENVIKKYEVSLVNEHVIFDSATFPAFEDALEWSLGRGAKYHVNILCESENVSWYFAVNGQSILNLNPFSREWYYIKKEDVKKECGTVLDPEYM